VVSPDALIAKYGADTVRLYTLFIGPPEKDAEWNDRGMEGSWRFLNRVWRLVERSKVKSLKFKAKKTKTAENLRRKTHQTIKKVTEDLEREFHFNTAISAIMELVNETYKVQEQDVDLVAIKEALETTVILLSPLVPHIAEEMWQRLGKENSIFRLPWPTYDREIIQAEEILIVVQINGKVRAKITVPYNIEEEELKKLILEDGRVARWIEGKTPKRFLVVPKKLVSIVV
jgi:leucyl-tRNA synthetase